MRERILIFGVGKRCREGLALYEAEMKEFEIVAFIDNNAKKGDKLLGKKIITPYEITNYEYDSILISTSLYAEEIENQLINEIGITKKNIYKWYFEKEYIKKEVEKYYKEQMPMTQSYHLDSQKKVVIYTAIFGKKDILRDPIYLDKNADYVCLTDDRSLKSNIWKVEYVDINEVSDPRKKAEMCSTCPHIFFPEYEYSFYVDGNVKIIGNLRDYVNKYMGKTNMLVCTHPWRNCAYDEGAFSKNFVSYCDDDIDNQLDKYKEDGFPLKYGLISAGFVARKHNEKDIVEAMEMWKNEIINYSSNDQISFSYVAWKTNLKYDKSPILIYDNEYIFIEKHLK